MTFVFTYKHFFIVLFLYLFFVCVFLFEICTNIFTDKFQITRPRIHFGHRKHKKMDKNTHYGGVEGPDALYVKLISSDGHEFIVKREHALTSGTIKAMLSGPGQFAENEANEVNFREIP